MEQVIEILKRNLVESIEAKQELLLQEERLSIFGSAIAEVIKCYQQGGRIYIAGNGGSAADAQHLAAEFVSKFARDRSPLPAEALTVDSSVLTAIANDYGYEEVFSRQIYGKLKTGDMFLAITSSGNSLNILKALDACREMGITTVLFSGGDGGLAKKNADYCIVATGKKTSTIQEVHLVLLHTLCECVEQAMFFNKKINV